MSWSSITQMTFFFELERGNLMINPLKMNPTFKWKVLKVLACCGTLIFGFTLLINQTLIHTTCNFCLHVVPPKVLLYTSRFLLDVLNIKCWWASFTICFLNPHFWAQIVDFEVTRFHPHVQQVQVASLS